MGLKVLTPLIISAEFLLIGYILFDLHTSVFKVSIDDQENSGKFIALNTTIEDPKTVEMGKFAVDEFNDATKSDLIFKRVVNAAHEPSSHAMLIEVTIGGSSKLFGAIVMVEGGSRSLVAFEEYMASPDQM